MFVGREEELATLEERYALDSFQMVVLYGRRRVGKTALLEEFCRGKRALMFTAQVQSDIDNLRDFSRAVVEHFGLPATTPPFASWMDAFEFIAERADEDASQGVQRLVLVFDEFPYAARANPALPSTLQIAIDKHFKATPVFLILCGSNQGFMENEVLGEKSPLYGRRTAQLKLRPFDYRDAARMLPEGCSTEDKVSYYASLGGTPYYLEAIDPGKSYLENMTSLFFSRTGLMFDEPNMLLRQELREPAAYGSVLRAIAGGANRSNAIANRTGIASSSITAYLKVLVDLDLVERVVPIGESERSKKSLYRIKDPAFMFWYRFVAPYVTAIEAGLGEDVAVRLLEDERRLEYEGHVFERICREWIVRQARAGGLPVRPTDVGAWWGADPVLREQTDIDLVAADDIGHEAILCECKWRNSFDETEVLEGLRGKARLLPSYQRCWFFVFTKRPAGKASMQRAAEEGDARFICADELYEV